MPVRALTRAAFVTASMMMMSAAPAMAQLFSPGLVAVVTAADSLSPGARALAAGRAAHQAAWSQRQAGDYATAVQTIENALSVISKALELDLDASTRRDLVELQSRLQGLRDAARHELPSDTPKSTSDSPKPPSAAPSAAGNEPDSQVLNAPAAEGLEPQFNAEVYRYIEYFTGAGRSVFERWLRRSGRYMALFREVLQKEGLPPDLVHLVFVESGFNLHARSSSAAVGPWQFLRSTGRLFGLTVNQWVDERKDPEKSTVAAARYLKHLYTIFNDWPLTLASYNAGEGTILRAIKRQGTTNYWDLRLPRQTEDYVPQFMAVLAISRDPSKYGFDDVELDDPMNFDEIALRGSVDLRAIARLSECSPDELRDLNPAVLRHAAPGSDGLTMLRVPKGKGQVIMTKLQDGVAVPAVDLTVRHRVRRGETLQGIANQYHVDAARLARANGIGRKHPLRRGSVLTVRSSFTGKVALADLEPGDPRGSTRYVPTRDIRVPRTTLNAASDAEGRVTHVVRRGETLASIAAQYEVSPEDVRRWNHLSISKLRRGTRLKIRTGDAAIASPKVLTSDSLQIAALPAPRPASSRRTVVVQRGETLGVIARRHGTTITALKRANRLDGTVIRTGQRLKIPA